LLGSKSNTKGGDDEIANRDHGMHVRNGPGGALPQRRSARAEFTSFSEGSHYPAGVARKVVLHIGTHKTGTKSLQNMLVENESWFAEQQLYYPAAGRLPGGGHHNLAWELSGDLRFEPTNGSVDDLRRELRDHEPESVLLSSEDFESLYRRAEPLTHLRSTLEGLGYEVVVVVLLREPTDYVPSLYDELRKHGLRQTLDDFVAAILANGGVMFRNWDLRINFDTLLTGFADVFGADKVHAVRYDREDSVGIVLHAASVLLRLPLRTVEGWSRHNVRLPEQEGSAPGTATVDAGSCLSATQREAIDAAFGGLVQDLTHRYPVGAYEPMNVLHA
jgi:hypothetical protein